MCRNISRFYWYPFARPLFTNSSTTCKYCIKKKNISSFFIDTGYITSVRHGHYYINHFFSYCYVKHVRLKGGGRIPSYISIRWTDLGTSIVTPTIFLTSWETTVGFGSVMRKASTGTSPQREIPDMVDLLKDLFVTSRSRQVGPPTKVPLISCLPKDIYRPFFLFDLNQYLSLLSQESLYFRDFRFTFFNFCVGGISTTDVSWHLHDLLLLDIWNFTN